MRTIVCRQHARSVPQMALGLTVLLRVLYSGVGAIVASRLKLDPAVIESNRLTNDLTEPGAGWRYQFLGIWERFDTLWYLQIAQRGYEQPEAVVFYPLYPVLIRLASMATGHPLAAALEVTSCATFFLFWGLLNLLGFDEKPSSVRRALILYSVCPGSFIFFAGYADSLVAALTVWSIYFARRSEWSAAGVLGFCAGLTKAVKTLVVVPLLWLAFRRPGAMPRWVAAGVAALAQPCYCLYLSWFSLPLPSKAYQVYWQTEIVFPWRTLIESVQSVFREPNVLMCMNLGAWAAASVSRVWGCDAYQGLVGGALSSSGGAGRNGLWSLASAALGDRSGSTLTAVSSALTSLRRISCGPTLRVRPDSLAGPRAVETWSLVSFIVGEVRVAWLLSSSLMEYRRMGIQQTQVVQSVEVEV